MSSVSPQGIRVTEEMRQELKSARTALKTLLKQTLPDVHLHPDLTRKHYWTSFSRRHRDYQEKLRSTKAQVHSDVEVAISIATEIIQDSTKTLADLDDYYLAHDLAMRSLGEYVHILNAGVPR